MKQITFRQQQILDFLQDHLSGSGYPPTLREIAAEFGLSGPRAAVKHLNALERKGFIRRSPGSSRGIEILRNGNRNGSLRQVAAAGRRVPVLGTVPAGPLDLAFEDDMSTLILDPSIAGEGTFLLRVSGDSMEGDHIMPGDMVVVKRQDSAEEGDIVVALIGEEATLKRFRRSGGKITLIPSNPAHKPVVLDGKGNDVKIAGKVKAVIRITSR